MDTVKEEETNFSLKQQKGRDTQIFWLRFSLHIYTPASYPQHCSLSLQCNYPVVTMAGKPNLQQQSITFQKALSELIIVVWFCVKLWLGNTESLYLLWISGHGGLPVWRVDHH